MMVLPDVAFRVEDGNFPIKIAIAVLLNVYHLTPHGCAYVGTVWGKHVDPMVEVCLGGIVVVIIVLIRADQVPHLIEGERPAVAGMFAIRVAPGNAS